MKTTLYGSLMMILGISSAMASNNQGNSSLIIEQNYFVWEDDEDNEGYQLATPITFSHQYKEWNIGLRRAYISSHNDSEEREGDAEYWSDTSASVAFTPKQVGKTAMRYNLSVNIPNGQDKLYGDEKNAIMDGHLVWQTRFGEGWNFTPGVNVSHALTDKDTLGFGLSHSIRGEFDPNGDVVGDKIDPGDDTIATINYQHNEPKWFAKVGVTNQHSGVTQRGGNDYYQKGDMWSADLGGAVALTNRQSLRANYRYGYRDKDDYINNLTGNLQQEEFNSNGDTHFVNFDYGYKLDDKQSVHLIGDYLKVNSNEYDQINFLYVPAREKWSVGARYDWAIKDDVAMSLLAKRFEVDDDETPDDADGKHYDGWNVYANVKYDF